MIRMTSDEGIPELRYGNRVFSATMGDGTYLGTRDRGLVRVCFDRDKVERDWPAGDLGLVSTPSERPGSPPPPKINPTLAWNIALIAVGALITFVGLAAGLTADPENSAFRQTVKALWVIQGLIGLLIAAVGILGATIARTIDKDRS
jgi:hypothetical protein